MSQCLFCRIIAGEIPCRKVYEDDETFAFLDIGPVNVGHTLVVPKAHHENVAAMSEADAARLFASVHRVARAVAPAVGAEAFNIGVNTGAAAGQLVMHAHVHVMPRFPGDGLVHWPKREVSEEDMERAAEAIRKRLGA